MIEKLLSSEVQKFIKDHQNDDPFLLSLKVKKEGDFPLKEAIEQIRSRQKAKAKLPAWWSKEIIIWPKPVSVEQSSSELTGSFKASLIQGGSIVDLTGGMGVDASSFANHFDKVVYIEPNKDLCDLARHNFGVLEKDILVLQTTAEDFLNQNKQVFDAIYLDPSRRSGDRKVFKIEDCVPNLYQIIPRCLKFAEHLLIKLSPLVDLSLIIRDFRPKDIWIVAVKGEVKEVLFLIRKDVTDAKIHAVDLSDQKEPEAFDFKAEDEKQSRSRFSLPLRYIYEPNAAIMKSGAFKLVGERHCLYKLHQHTHLYTSDDFASDFPGKILSINKVLAQSKKDLHEAIPEKKINVITRNFPMSAVQLKKKFGLKDGGDQFLIGTTLMDGKKALLLCDRLD